MEAAQLIISGAGQAGLAAVYEARRAGLEPVVLEASGEPAGSWPAYYDSLRLFSPARFSSLPGQTFGGDPDRYPTRDEVIDYLRTYAAWLKPDLCYHAPVDTVSHADGQLCVRTATGSVFLTDTLIAATGSFRAPYLPPLDGLATFDGSVLHSSQYVTPDRFVGARVVVVGAGNSAVQIASELASVADVTLATRDPIRWVRQRPLNRDVHWWLDRTRLDRAPLGDWLRYLPVSVLDQGVYQDAVQQGRPDRRPMLLRLHGNDVVWEDGRYENVDALILATGYRPNFPYLKAAGALGSSGDLLQRFGVSTTVPGLGYVGLEFQRTFSSATLRGVGPDARYVFKHLRRRPA